MNDPAKTIIAGLLGFGLIVVSAFTPWFEWTWQEGPNLWHNPTSVWGPPAYISGMPYFIVETATNSQNRLDTAIGLYLLIFLLGTGLWSRLLWTLKSTVSVWLALGVGIISIMIGGGVVIWLGLAEVVAQRVGLYAAIATDRIVMAELEHIQLTGPLILLGGIIIEITAAIWRRRLPTL